MGKALSANGCRALRLNAPPRPMCGDVRFVGTPGGLGLGPDVTGRVGVMPFCPLGHGWLSVKFPRGIRRCPVLLGGPRWGVLWVLCCPVLLALHSSRLRRRSSPRLPSPPYRPLLLLVRGKFLETSRNMPLAAPCSALGPGAGAASPRVAHTRARTHGGPGGRPALSGRALSGRALSGRALSGRALSGGARGSCCRGGRCAGEGPRSL